MIRKSIKPIQVHKISENFIGDGLFFITEVSGLSSCGPNGMAFYKGDDVDFIKKANVGVLIVKDSLKTLLEKETLQCKAVIFTKIPMGFFASFVNKRFNNDFTDKLIDMQNATDHAMISKDAYVESEVSIGENSKIFPKSAIFNGTTIGQNCVVQSNSVIGGIGMSYVQDENGEYTRLTHLGDVIIEDNVDIGCNTTVLKGILESTIIKKGAKIGNQVNIGHNSIIGENTYISAGAVVGGATVIGRNCWIAPGVSIRDNIKIGDNCTLGLGCVVVKDTEPNTIYIGNPARIYKRKEV